MDFKQSARRERKSGSSATVAESLWGAAEGLLRPDHYECSFFLFQTAHRLFVFHCKTKLIGIKLSYA